MKQIKKKASSVVLNLVDVTKSYGQINAVCNLSFEASRGEIIALLGPNGAGKSTLMNMIAGFLAPTAGDIFVLGKNIAFEDLFAKKNIGFLPEGAPMYADMTVKLFLQYMIALKLNYTEDETMSKQKINDLYRQEFNRITETAKITGVLEQRIETLSKGFLRRVGFAQSIIGNPPILLLDEPTDGLDPNQKEHMRNLIKTMGNDKTIIISTHLLDEAENIASRIILINKGKIVIDGTLEQILTSSSCASLEEAFKTLTQTGE